MDIHEHIGVSLLCFPSHSCMLTSSLHSNSPKCINFLYLFWGIKLNKFTHVAFKMDKWGDNHIPNSKFTKANPNSHMLTHHSTWKCWNNISQVG